MPALRTAPDARMGFSEFPQAICLDWHILCCFPGQEAKMQAERALETPYYCRIEVRGQLDRQTAVRFAGFSVERAIEGTILEGLVRNQLDLCGTLLRLTDLNLPVSSLSYSEVGEDEAAAELG